MYYMPEERLNISKRVFTQEISKEKLLANTTFLLLPLLTMLKSI